MIHLEPTLRTLVAPIRRHVAAALTGIDFDFSALIRYATWTDGDGIFIAPRDKSWNLELQNPEIFPRAVVEGTDCGAVASRRITLGVPYDLSFANLKLVRSELTMWDGKNTAQPNASEAH